MPSTENHSAEPALLACLATFESLGRSLEIELLKLDQMVNQACDQNVLSSRQMDLVRFLKERVHIGLDWQAQIRAETKTCTESVGNKLHMNLAKTL